MRFRLTLPGFDVHQDFDNVLLNQGWNGEGNAGLRTRAELDLGKYPARINVPGRAAQPAASQTDRVHW